MPARLAARTWRHGPVAASRWGPVRAGQRRGRRCRSPRGTPATRVSCRGVGSARRRRPGSPDPAQRRGDPARSTSPTSSGCSPTGAPTAPAPSWPPGATASDAPGVPPGVTHGGTPARRPCVGNSRPAPSGPTSTALPRGRRRPPHGVRGRAGPAASRAAPPDRRSRTALAGRDQGRSDAGGGVAGLEAGVHRRAAAGRTRAAGLLTGPGRHRACRRLSVTGRPGSAARRDRHCRVRTRPAGRAGVPGADCSIFVKDRLSRGRQRGPGRKSSRIPVISRSPCTRDAVVASRAPAAASRAPAITSRAPAIASRAPATASRAPATASRAPAITSRAPAIASRAPAFASSAPLIASAGTIAVSIDAAAGARDAMGSAAACGPNEGPSGGRVRGRVCVQRAYSEPGEPQTRGRVCVQRGHSEAMRGRVCVQRGHTARPASPMCPASLVQ